MDYLAAACMVKDESDYIQEWIEFHRGLGVDRFYIYDNGSKFPLRSALNQYIKEGIVLVVDWPGTAVQMAMYKDFLTRFKDVAVWVGMFDPDEFLFPITGEDLPSVLKPYEKYGGLAINTLFYGSSGHKNKPGGLQIESYLKRTPDGNRWNRTMKSIIRPDKVRDIKDPHSFHYKDGYHCVNEDGTQVEGPFMDVTVSKIRFNHYYTRSEQEYSDKIARGRPDVPGERPNYFTEIDSNSTVTDDTIVRFVPMLKKRLAALATRRASAIDGWMEVSELEWLAEAAVSRSTIVELGSWKGRSTKALAVATPGVVYAVDTWRGTEADAHYYEEVKRIGAERMVTTFLSNLWEEIAARKLVPVVGPTEKSAETVRSLLGGRSADMVFIDADHRYESVKADILAYRPLLSKGGLLCGHDYHPTWSGVVQAVNELVPDVQRGNGNIWFKIIE